MMGTKCRWERGDENIQENSLNTSLLINLTGPQTCVQAVFMHMFR